mmetsp:Transcript_2193/g.4882  ORF Transcript_2193/g.4882 Transcript_2193/m.4882 type:complete len:336 (+) Transcript_2193:209-1216(+)
MQAMGFRVGAGTTVLLVVLLALLVHKGPLYGCPPEAPLVQSADDGVLGAEVHVLLASDRSQLPGMLISMISVSRNLAPSDHCVMHIVVAREDMELVRGMLGCFREELASDAVIPSVQLHEVRWPPFNLTEFPTFFEHDVWGYRKPWIWSKVYAHEYLPNVSRALWLDNDVIVNAPLAPLYRMHMSRPFAAAVDQEYPYELNTGMLLYNMELFKSERVANAVENWLYQWWEEALRPGGRFSFQAFHEQTALSDLFLANPDPGQRAHIIDWRWNAVGLWNLWRIGSCARDAHILHFNGFPLKYWDWRFPAWTINSWKYGVMKKYAPRHCAPLNWSFT